MEWAVDFIKEYGLLAPLFILIMDSATPLGIFMPGLWMPVATGALCSMGILDPIPAFTVNVIGTFLGDIIGFSLGYWFEVHIFHRRHFHSLEKLGAHKRYLFVFILLSRFLVVVKSVIPNFVGLLQVSRRVFLAADLLGAFLWIGVYFALGMALGEGERFLQYSLYANVLLVVLALSVLTLFFKWQRHTQKKLFHRRMHSKGDND